MSEEQATRPHRLPDWSEEEDKILVAGIEKRWSAERIAYDLPGRSRNAVIGRINRQQRAGKFPQRPPTKFLSAPTPPGPTSSAGPRRRGAEAGAKRSRPPLTPTPTPQQQPIVRQVCDEPVEPIGQGCGILELTKRRCKWPLNAPPRFGVYRFCGGRALAGLPYCGFHTRLSIQPRWPRVGASQKEFV